jgi:hypothetical protein
MIFPGEDFGVTLKSFFWGEPLTLRFANIIFPERMSLTHDYEYKKSKKSVSAHFHCRSACVGRIGDMRNLTALVIAFVVGCSGPKEKPSDTKPIPNDNQKAKVRKEIFDATYRVATELEAAQEVGINREKFGTLLQQFNTEIMLAKDKAESPPEKHICDGYSAVLQIYKDAGKVWDLKISIPKLVYDAKVFTDTFAAGDTKLITQLYSYRVATIDGIPLNLFPMDKGSTGIDDVVSKYNIPVKEQDSWKTIPSDSIQLIWAKAKEKNDEVKLELKGK